jgi:signal transduction histidine kinase
LAVDPDAGGSPSGFHIVHVADLGALALLRLPARGGGPRLLATSAVEEQAALQAFVRVLAALTLAGGLAALPAGYVLAGIALRPLDEAVRERSRFVALASHQLRTPLAVIRTALELAEGGRGLTAAAALRTVGEQARRMERLAERLTALAHAEAGTPAAAPGADLAAAAAGGPPPRPPRRRESA